MKLLNLTGPLVAALVATWVKTGRLNLAPCLRPCAVVRPSGQSQNPAARAARAPTVALFEGHRKRLKAPTAAVRPLMSREPSFGGAGPQSLLGPRNTWLLVINTGVGLAF